MGGKGNRMDESLCTYAMLNETLPELFSSSVSMFTVNDSTEVEGAKTIECFDYGITSNSNGHSAGNRLRHQSEFSVYE